MSPLVEMDDALASSRQIPRLLFVPPTNSSTAAKPNVQAPTHGDARSDKTTQRSVQKLPKYKHAIAIHSKERQSCLTSGSDSNVSFAGLRNLMVLVIVVSNLRLMIENYKKYGFLVCVRCHNIQRQDLVNGAILFFLVPCHLLVAYIIEFVAAQQAKGALGRMKKTDSPSDATSKLDSATQAFKSTWQLVALAHGTNATLNLVIATAVVYFFIHHPGIGTLCELHAIIVWLKVCSYAFTNRDLRHALLSPSAEPVPDLYASCPYPRNITLYNLSYFWWAPTLVYQPVYPRTSHVRWVFVGKRACEVAILSVAIWIASAQYAVPLLQNSLPIMSSLDVMAFLERLMKLSSISLFCWLAGFYALFQSYLNGLAEVMTFADREFYSDWWNSPNVRVYWTSWNKPVYQFMKRHIYMPMVSRGVSSQTAQIITFVFSGVLHEIIVGVPTHNIIGVAFAGMMLQIPLIVLTDQLRKIKGFGGATAGNVIFWVTFVLVGQPLAAMLYFFAWQAKYGSVSVPDFHLHWRGLGNMKLGMVGQ